MRNTTDIRGTRVGRGTAGGSVSGRWSLVASAEILGCPGPTVPLGWRYVWYFGTRGLWCYGILDLWMFRFYRYLRKTKNRCLCVFASRLVLGGFFESYGMLVAVSAPLVMPLHDSDILMNVPFKCCNNQPNAQEKVELEHRNKKKKRLQQHVL